MTISEHKVDQFLVQAKENIDNFPELQTLSSCFSWASHRIRVVFVGVENTRFFTDAISHRMVQEGADDEELTIYVVDESVAGSVLPAPFWGDVEFDPYGRLKGLEGDCFVEYTSDNRVLVILSRRSGICVMWVRNVAQLPEWERSFPFRGLLYQWFKNSNFLFLHAGAVGRQNGGVLLTGKGGMGKSTATLACLDSDLQYAGDDFVMVDTETLEVHSLYNVAKLEASNLHRFPKLEPYIANPDSLPENKGQLFLHFFKPEALIDTFRLSAIFMPKFAGQENTTIRNATKGEALLALAPSTMGLLKGDIQMMSRIAELVQKLPCYWIETGTSLDKIPSTISSWLNNKSNV